MSLTSEAAVAISYTWGEFDRRKVTMGYYAGGGRVELAMGEEWDTLELKVQLSEICPEKQACWLDQLCTPQEEEKLRITLARILIIYRTLGVIVMMPGRPCQYLPRIAAEASEALKMNDWTAAWNVVKELSKCLGSMGLCSYFDRVWTRQEVLYSRRIRLVWTGQEESPCAKSEGEITTLVGYAGLLREKLEPKDKVFLYLDLANRKFFNTIAQLLGFYSGWFSNETYDGPANNEVIIRFLSGESLENPHPVSHGMSVDDQVERFVHRMAFLGTSARTATKVDCPGYEIPEDYKTLGIGRLLENAIRQFEKLHGKSINVCAPAGLFEYSCSERAL